jgi:glutathione synthase/RimK-type ligase-like ATP-grasp enzyme
LKKYVVFFEAEGGTDKGPDGHRRDTMPMVEALRAGGWSADTIFYRDVDRDELFDRVVAKADAYVSRINPGTIPGGEAAYFDMLRKLCAAGVVGMPHPDAMTGYGAKDALVKLVGTGLVPPDTTAYYTVDDFTKRFPAMLAGGRRVLKQNRGSTGEGIWLVSVDDPRPLAPGAAVPLDARVKCVEAVDNHVEHHTLAEFMNYCEQYIVGDNGMLVDMPFMPRIKEGEIRILLVGTTPIFVVHKKPAEAADAFSATLFSGAKYTYDEPEKWRPLVDMFLGQLPEVMKRLGGHEIPLIWTADFMLDTKPDGSDAYVLGEINCSCVGFTTHLEHGIQQKIAAEIIHRVSRAGVPSPA